jgi:predicted dehydrogenase
MEVIGTRGSVELDHGVEIRQYGDVARRVDIADASLGDALRAEQVAFIEGIRTGRRPRDVTMRDACAGLALADAILESLRSGTPVRVAPPAGSAV